ncbi:MAG: hypothetical protein JWO38_7931 [Gemmataceae bacterium]|nr:hypothetical protein [Gemmataceae bacterium]
MTGSPPDLAVRPSATHGCCPLRVFVFEHLTAHGLGRDPADPIHPMYREGRAMRDAAVTDFGRVPGVEVFAFPDADVPVDSDRFHDAASVSDWTLVIAPECDDILTSLARAVESSGSTFLGPVVESVRLTSDKFALANHWREHGILTPATTGRHPTACEAFPVVWKPRDGAGSTATFLLTNPFDVARAKALAAGAFAGPMILQEFIPGQAASVAFLCGPAGNIPLLPTLQHLSDDGRFHYSGGELPISPPLAERAILLGRRAIDCVPGLKGYVGVDLILGAEADGSRDYAIEINPRLTTSYVGLRAIADFNLAAAMLLLAAGESAPAVAWKPGRLQFAPDGVILPVV